MAEVKQVSIHRKVNHDTYCGCNDYDFAESHDEFVGRVTQEINNLGKIKLISVNYVDLSKVINRTVNGFDNKDEEVAVVTYYLKEKG